ncbi:lysophospholipid acyltransferase 2-like [Halichondria panicea]|uniref:lysophospholipid acyltransferase 2-like n=1 Tax=Halichondria panicea TaxID=6063 RepID=UPI00312BA9FC
MLQYLPATVVQRYTMVWAMGSMSAAHIYRMMTDYGGWSLDFTGPLMIIVQKVTLVAFALHDGKGRSDSSLNQDQREQKIDVCPSPLEYFTYIFNFHSFLAGPSFSIKDFLAFMDGSNLKTKEHVREPSATFAIVSKFVYSLVSLFFWIYLGLHYTPQMTYDPQYSTLGRLYIVFFYGLVFRLKYYFLWYLVDSVNNTCGLGFSGYDTLGQPKWDLVSDINFAEIEAAPNIRALSTYWHATAGKWLRRVCYERVTFSPTYTSFIMSAWWHGFYPGYFFMFLSFAVAAEAARKMRRLIRPHFQSSLPLKWSYDVLTIVATHLCMDYCQLPIAYLWLSPSLQFYSYFYFIPNIVILLVALLLPAGKSSRQTGKLSDKTLTEAKSKEH